MSEQFKIHQVRTKNARTVVPFPPANPVNRLEEDAMRTKLSDGYSGFMHLVERRMLLHEEMDKLVRKHEIGTCAHPFRFITISREIGALGEAVSSELAAKLRWKLYDKEVVDFIAKHNHVLAGIVNQLDEKTQSRIQDGVERLLLTFHGQGFSNDAYHMSLIQALAVLAEQEKCIILGHGGTFALQDHPGLHVKITASRKVRIERLSLELGVSRDKAEKIVQKTDKEKNEFIHHHFTLDRKLDEYFHMVFNTDKCSIDTVTAAIIGTVQLHESRNETVH